MMKKEQENDIHRYDDILHLPHHVSKTHPQMSIHDRAAQFAPFAALTAHGTAIRETARLTDQKIELDENLKTMLDQKLQLIWEQLDMGAHPEVEIIYFVKDARKEGGAYVNICGHVQKINEYLNIVVMQGGMQIPTQDIAQITLI